MGIRVGHNRATPLPHGIGLGTALATFRAAAPDNAVLLERMYARMAQPLPLC